MFYDQQSLWPVICCMTVSEEMIVNRGCFDYKGRKEGVMEEEQQMCPLFISIVTLMIIENRALWLARSFASFRYNHQAVIITLKASSFQNGSQICWCFGVRNWSIILFSWIIINVIILKQLVASGDVNIGE